MIHSLYIKNFALVDEINIRFDDGLNIITGETGAGKSILVNAISQLCGERSSPDLVRSGAGKAVIEARFKLESWPELNNLARELELEIENFSEILIRKEISANGNTRIFVNDSPVTLNRLNKFSTMLLDLHGQHQHQRLLHPENHITYLDEFGSYGLETAKFSEILDQYKSELSVLTTFKTRQHDSFQKHDLYKYQFEELSKAELQEGELESLSAELKILSNVEALHQLGGTVSQTLYTGEHNAGNMLAAAEDELGQLETLDEKFSGLRNNLADARQTVEEIGRFTEQYLSELEFSPERMEFIHQRVAQLEFLLKKYQRRNIAELMMLHQEMQILIQGTEQFDDLIKEQEQKIEQTLAMLNKLGAMLSHKRNETAVRLEQTMTKILSQVGMVQARFRVSRELNKKENAIFSCNGLAVQADKRGFDKIVFEIASNRGQQFKPIHKTASGGEISRLMLALKTVLAESDKIPSLVFDEIDAGISGKIAQIVGAKLSSLSHFHQILCVTHLPQIAAFANNHYKVEKSIEDNRTLVDIKLLNGPQRENELAALLGGEQISAQAIENARLLIQEANKL